MNTSNECKCKADYIEVSGVCVACHGSCQTCSGTSGSDCLSCESNDFRKLKTSANECNCQCGYFDKAGVCTACDSSCLTCSG